jgi:hypothetical protein
MKKVENLDSRDASVSFGCERARSVRWRGWRQVSAVRVCRYSGEAQGLKPLMGAAPEGGPAARPGHTSSAHAPCRRR